MSPSTFTFTSLLLPLLSPLISAATSPSCHTSSIPDIKIPGVQVQHVLATEVKDHAPWAFALGSVPSPEHPIDFCNITLTYTHPGWHDAVHVSIWLPLSPQDWNGRYLGTGGGGWAAGFEGSLAAGVGLGYAAAMTDAGHASGMAATTEAGWLLTDESEDEEGMGSVNLPLVFDFAYVALDDMSQLAKRVVHAYYGREAEYSYWSGCSTGGRQGMALAQRFPEHYDGILAAAPAMNWASFVVAELWPQVVMNELGVYPPACELQAITAAAIEACDELDGVRDGIVAAHGQCDFDPSTAIGKEVTCNGEKDHISAEAAHIATETWRGPRRTANSKIEWPGLSHEASFYTEAFGPFGGLAQTSCPSESPNEGSKCSGVPFIMSSTYIRYMLAKTPSFPLTSTPSNLTREDFFDLLHQSHQEWHSVLDTADPDLSAFKASGGKLLHWHGIADQLIPVNGSSSYYSRVEALDPDVRDFYRYFEAPGVTHCAGGPGPFPERALEELVRWVEEGVAPEFIEGVAGDVKRPICAWPKVAAFKGGDVNAMESFECREGFGAFGFPKVNFNRGNGVRDEL
jgi:hypothetical protein